MLGTRRVAFGVCLICHFIPPDEVTPGSAMRNRSVSVIFGTLVLWGLVTYFLISDQPESKEGDTVSTASETFRGDRVELRGKDDVLLFLDQSVQSDR